MIARILNWQGIAGLALSGAVAVLLVLQKTETRHWKAESARFQQAYAAEHSAFATTVANYRSAAAQARAEDKANAVRVAAAQQAISERTSHDFESRIAAARADALRVRTAAAATDSGGGGAAPVPGLSAAPRGASQSASQGQLPPSDALIATEQAIQLDALIEWVRAEARVDMNGPPR